MGFLYPGGMLFSLVQERYVGELRRIWLSEAARLKTLFRGAGRHPSQREVAPMPRN